MKFTYELEPLKGKITSFGDGEWGRASVCVAMFALGHGSLVSLTAGLGLTGLQSN